MSFIEIPTDTIRGSIDFFCNKLHARLIEQSDHFAHVEYFDQEIIFHFDPTYRKEKRSNFYTILVPNQESFKKIYDICINAKEVEIIKDLRSIAGHVKMQAFTIIAVSGHHIEFKYYLHIDEEIKISSNE